VARLLPALLVAGVVLTGCTQATHARSSGRTEIHVSVSQCGTGWADPKAGMQHFDLVNSDTRAGEVLLTDAASGAVYADIEPLGPGTHRDLDVDLGSGRYAFRCAMEDESVVVGATVKIPGQVKGSTPAVLPVTQADLIEATKSYEAYVRGRIPALLRLTRGMNAAVDRGDLAAARTAWLPAHLEYERLGAAYDAFGDLDGEINGLPDGRPNGIADKGWTGFHRVEYGLWHGAAAASLRAPTAALLAAVGSLGAEFAHAQIAPLDVSIRAHEITENALQFELTGKTDFGSHSNLATVRANLDGTRAVLALLQPLLAKRYAGLGEVNAELTRTQDDIAAVHSAPLTTLTTAQRERIDSDVSELCELLAPVASILEPRRSS
jgi:iron uptake system component EfeO